MDDNNYMGKDFMKDKIKSAQKILDEISKNFLKADEAIEYSYAEINSHDELDNLYYETFDDEMTTFNYND